jgi:serine/threonine protein kinase
MSPKSSAEFVDSIAGLALLTEDRMRELRETIANEFPDPSRLGAELRRRGWLTPFQLDRLMRGEGRELVLGAYQLLEPIGVGGMGRVFKGRHTIMDRIVAIKVIHPRMLGEPESIRRFRHEIVAAAKLNHPNIITTHDAQEVDGQVFLVMEFCNGADLAKLVSENGPLPIGEACDYVRQAALGLDHIHENGLIHRDIKPQNLLLTGTTIKILDLGLARLRPIGEAGSYSSLTGEGIVLGTPDYLAPEQAEDARRADIRSDIYSLGSTLYYLIADQVPFPGGAVLEKVLRQRVEDPVPLQRLRPDVLRPVQSIVQKMMAKSPNDRYQTPRDVAAALAPFSDTHASLQQDRIQLSPSTFDPTLHAAKKEQPPPKRISRRTAVVALAGVGVGAASLAIIFKNWPGEKKSPNRDPGDNGNKEPTPGPAPPPKSAPGQWRPGKTFPYRPEIVRPDVAEGIWAVALSPDGRSAAVGFGDLFRTNQLPGIVRILDFENGKWRETDKFDKCGVSRVAFANNGRTLIAASGILKPDMSGSGELMIHDLGKGQTRFTPVVFEGVQIEGLLGMAVDPRLRWAVVTGRRGQLLRVSLESGKGTLEKLDNEFNTTISGLAVSSDGSLLGIGYQDGKLEVREAENLTRLVAGITVGKADAVRITGMAFRNDDKELVGATWHKDGGDSVIRIWDLTRKQMVSEIPETGFDIYSMALAPDGRTLATGAANGVLRITDLTERRLLFAEQAHQETIYGLSFAQDGRTLASCSTDRSVRLWQRD